MGIIKREIIEYTCDLYSLRKDAERYRLLRRGQHWSVINGIGDELRSDALDVAIDAVMENRNDS